MASHNIAEWTPEQVAEWMSGLGESVEQYASTLAARGVDGNKLLSLRCDDLDYLGIRLIGHQELLLEAVEQLRNFHYEARRECPLQLAVVVSAAGSSLARALRHEALETQTLADVARLVHAIKPLVCWLHRWPRSCPPQLQERKALLLQVSLAAATCAQRDRFAEQPARTVAASAAAAAAAADYIIQDVSDPGVVTPATLEAAALRQAGRPLGFTVRRGANGRLQLAHVRFGSPAHASGAVHAGDELVQVGSRCVVGWSGPAVTSLCAAIARSGSELCLLLRRRGARPPPPVRLPPPPPSDSEPSPPASPTEPIHTRMYPPKPRPAVRRRHSVSGGSPVARRPALSIHQFWHELKEQKWSVGGGSANISPSNDDCALYRRDKAVSCSTGLELSPRPRTCLGVARPPSPPPSPAPAPAPSPRGRLDKSHSTPAYDPARDDPGSLATQTIPESPTTPSDSPTVLIHSAEKADTILDFKKSSSQIGEAILRRGEHPAEAVNTTLLQAAEAPAAAYNPLLSAPPAPPPRPAPASVPATPSREFPTLRIVPRQPDTPDKKEYPVRVPRPDYGRQLSKQDILVVGERRQLPALNAAPDPPPPAVHPVTNNTGTGRGIFPSSKTRSLKKKNSLLAKRRSVSWRTLCTRGGAHAAEGFVWQRVRAGGAAPRWARRHLLLLHNLLYAYRSPECGRASCMISLAGFTAAAAGEVKSRPHAFKVYHTGTAFYFAAASRDHMAAWLQLLARATLGGPGGGGGPGEGSCPPLYSETEYSDTESDSEHPERRERDRDIQRERDKDRDKDKSKFGSLKKLTSRMSRAESSEAVCAAAASLDRKYLRFFSRHKHKDEHKPKSKPGGVPVPTPQYRSYRRAPPAAAAPAPAPAPALSLSNLSALAQADWPAPLAPTIAPVAENNRSHTGSKPDRLLGFVTLEEFMLKKQEEERKQMYSNRVLMGVERPAAGGQSPPSMGGGQSGSRSLHRQLQRIVPDVIYGELPPQEATPSPAAPQSPPPPAASQSPLSPPRALPAPPPPVRVPPPTGPKPISVKGKDGYEKIVYPEEVPSPAAPPAPSPAPPPASTPERWRDSLRRNDKVLTVHSGSTGLKLSTPPAATTPNASIESWSAGGVSRLRLMFGPRGATQVSSPTNGTVPPASAGSWSRGGGGAGGVYPHLQCPPTFQPETYSLAGLTPQPHHHPHPQPHHHPPHQPH